jgi:hypothetical protein
VPQDLVHNIMQVKATWMAQREQWEAEHNVLPPFPEV